MGLPLPLSLLFSCLTPTRESVQLSGACSSLPLHSARHSPTQDVLHSQSVRADKFSLPGHARTHTRMQTTSRVVVTNSVWHALGRMRVVLVLLLQQHCKTCTPQGWPIRALPNRVTELLTSKQVLRALCMAAAWTAHRPVHSNTFKGCVTAHMLPYNNLPYNNRSSSKEPARHVQANSFRPASRWQRAGVRGGTTHV
jgi:hypothetical protein